MRRTLLAIPVFGSPELTDAVLRDLLRDDPLLPSWLRLVVVDNQGDYVLPGWAYGVEVHRPGTNLRWIGTANWAFAAAVQTEAEVVVLLNNDTRLSRGFLRGLVGATGNGPDGRIGVAAACYDDFWLHQRAAVVPPDAEAYVPKPVLRDVPFCDGTAIAFTMSAVRAVGGLDTDAFPGHGYGADLDWAIRARAAGWRCVVTEEAYVHHLRRVTMTRVGRTAEENRAEIITGLDARWGERWRALVGLGPDAFPPHNTRSALDWYAEPAWVLGLIGEPSA